MLMKMVVVMVVMLMVVVMMIMLLLFGFVSFETWTLYIALAVLKVCM